MKEIYIIYSQNFTNKQQKNTADKLLVSNQAWGLILGRGFVPVPVLFCG